MRVRMKSKNSWKRKGGYEPIFFSEFPADDEPVFLNYNGLMKPKKGEEMNRFYKTNQEREAYIEALIEMEIPVFDDGEKELKFNRPKDWSIEDLDWLLDESVNFASEIDAELIEDWGKIYPNQLKNLTTDVRFFPVSPCNNGGGLRCGKPFTVKKSLGKRVIKTLCRKYLQSRDDLDLN